jgi:hypothetical protein
VTEDDARRIFAHFYPGEELKDLAALLVGDILNDRDPQQRG